MGRNGIIGVLALAVVLSGCNNSPTSSSTNSGSGSTALNLNGTWSGSLAIQGAVAQMTWTLSQTNNAVIGPVLVALTSGTVVLNGSLSGTITGGTVTYTIAVGPGALPSQPACTGQLAGSVAAATGPPATLTGSYSVATSTCSTPFSSGSFTLTKSGS